MYFLLINVNSIVNKHLYIYDICRDFDFRYNVVGITESWLLPEIASSTINMRGYSLYRNDTDTGRRKHGVCIYIHNSIAVGQVFAEHPNTIGLHLPHYNIYVLLVYRPPSNTPDLDENLVNYMVGFCTNRSVYVMGDFNLPTVQWLSDPPIATSARDRSFLDCFFQLGLIQHVKQPTFVQSGRTLDLVLSPALDYVSLVSTLPPLPGCGHVPVSFAIAITCHQRPEFHSELPSPLVRNWHKGDFAAMSRSLEDVDWVYEFTNRNIEQAYTYLNDYIQNLINLYINFRYLQPKKSEPWNKNLLNRLKKARATSWENCKQAIHHNGRQSPSSK